MPARTQTVTIKASVPVDDTDETIASKARLDKFVQEFNAAFGKASISCTIDSFESRPETYSGIIVSCEGGNEMDGIPAFDYYEELDHLMKEAESEFGPIDREPSYDGGILDKARKWLEARGARAEFYDAGTVEIWMEEDD